MLSYNHHLAQHRQQSVRIHLVLGQCSFTIVIVCRTHQELDSFKKVTSSGNNYYDDHVYYIVMLL